MIEESDPLVTELLLELHEPFKVEDRRTIAAKFLNLAYERGQLVQKKIVNHLLPKSKRYNEDQLKPSPYDPAAVHEYLRKVAG